MTLPSPLEIGAIGSALIVGAGLVFFFLKAFEMAMLLGAAGGALIVVAGLLSQYVQMGDDRRAAEDKPMMDRKDADLAACSIDKKTALDANVSLQTDVERIKREQAAQNAAVDELKKRTDEAIDRSAKAQAGNVAKIRALESDQSMLWNGAAAGLAKGISCPKATVQTTGDWHAFATREIADRPPTNRPPAAPSGGLSVK